VGLMSRVKQDSFFRGKQKKKNPSSDESLRVPRGELRGKEENHPIAVTNPLLIGRKDGKCCVDQKTCIAQG